ncbi:MAG: efflux RND transporter periplasmic adaptor subunit, partial [Muribaculaceae bacterium]|nr:efflux RND transporter periplasmic adaptor subunit [Muribaculaceae bacterium]
MEQSNMDRVIPREEQRKAAIRKWIKIAVPAAVAVVAVVVSASLMQSGIKRSSIRIGVADVGTLETSVTGTGRVTPA